MNKMRDDQDFNIHFVQIIEKERSLYDKTLPEYRSKDEHERIWQKISTEVNESGKNNKRIFDVFFFNYICVDLYMLHIDSNFYSKQVH